MRKPIRRKRDGSFKLDLADHEREFLHNLVTEMKQLVTSDAPIVTRLYPTAYGTDAERNAGWDALARGELVESRLGSLDVVQRVLDREIIDAEELSAFMRVLNDARLVFGSALDVSEDEPLDPSTPEELAMTVQYEFLTMLVGQSVRALQGTL